MQEQSGSNEFTISLIATSLHSNFGPLSVFNKQDHYHNHYHYHHHHPNNQRLHHCHHHLECYTLSNSLWPTFCLDH